MNAASGVNAGGCTVQASPCKTITYAMTQAATGAPGDLINVSPGVYNASLGESFPIAVKSGVQLKATSGAAATFVDAAGQARIFEMTDANSSTLVEGFTIARGMHYPSGLYAELQAATGGALLITNSSPTIRKNVFAGNQVQGYPVFDVGGAAFGGAIYVASGSPYIANNVFKGNVARAGRGVDGIGKNGGVAYGGAIYSSSSSLLIVNNTFYTNSAIGGAGGTGSATVPGGSGGNGRGGAVNSSGCNIINNIFDSNATIGGAGSSGSPNGTTGIGSYGAMTCDILPQAALNNLFHANVTDVAASTDDTTGTNPKCYATPCTSVLYHLEPANLRLQPSSPASGQGVANNSPADDLDGAARPSPPSIGAYEASAVALPPRLINISTRMQVLTGNDVMIGGFIIGGSSSKTVVVRARGPSLVPFGITNALADPQLVLVRSSDQATIASNDNWAFAPNAAAITASGFAPSNNFESAILINLAPGGYTAIVSGADGGTGVGIVEVFELDALTVPLTNISTRGQVLTANDVMIGGFVVQGSGPQTVVVRARGPSLVPFGITNALANPRLQLVRSSDQVTIATNDDWQSASNAAAITTSGFAPSNNLESAILITLQPGAYTAIVTGVGGGTGVGIVEVFTTP